MGVTWGDFLRIFPPLNVIGAPLPCLGQVLPDTSTPGAGKNAKASGCRSHIRAEAECEGSADYLAQDHRKSKFRRGRKSAYVHRPVDSMSELEMLAQLKAAAAAYAKSHPNGDSQVAKTLIGKHRSFVGPAIKTPSPSDLIDALKSVRNHSKVECLKYGLALAGFTTVRYKGDLIYVKMPKVSAANIVVRENIHKLNVDNAERRIQRNAAKRDAYLRSVGLLGAPLPCPNSCVIHEYTRGANTSIETNTNVQYIGPISMKDIREKHVTFESLRHDPVLQVQILRMLHPHLDVRDAIYAKQIRSQHPLRPAAVTQQELRRCKRMGLPEPVVSTQTPAQFWEELYDSATKPKGPKYPWIHVEGYEDRLKHDSRQLFVRLRSSARGGGEIIGVAQIGKTNFLKLMHDIEPNPGPITRNVLRLCQRAGGDCMSYLSVKNAAVCHDILNRAIKNGVNASFRYSEGHKCAFVGLGLPEDECRKWLMEAKAICGANGEYTNLDDVQYITLVYTPKEFKSIKSTIDWFHEPVRSTYNMCDGLYRTTYRVSSNAEMADLYNSFLHFRDQLNGTHGEVTNDDDMGKSYRDAAKAKGKGGARPSAADSKPTAKKGAPGASAPAALVTELRQATENAKAMEVTNQEVRAEASATVVAAVEAIATAVKTQEKAQVTESMGKHDKEVLSNKKIFAWRSEPDKYNQLHYETLSSVAQNKSVLGQIFIQTPLAMMKDSVAYFDELTRMARLQYDASAELEFEMYRDMDGDSLQLSRTELLLAASFKCTDKLHEVLMKPIPCMRSICDRFCDFTSSVVPSQSTANTIAAHTALIPAYTYMATRACASSLFSLFKSDKQKVADMFPVVDDDSELSGDLEHYEEMFREEGMSVRERLLGKTKKIFSLKNIVDHVVVPPLAVGYTAAKIASRAVSTATSKPVLTRAYELAVGTPISLGIQATTTAASGVANAVIGTGTEVLACGLHATSAVVGGALGTAMMMAGMVADTPGVVCDIPRKVTNEVCLAAQGLFATKSFGTYDIHYITVEPAEIDAQTEDVRPLSDRGGPLKTQEQMSLVRWCVVQCRGLWRSEIKVKFNMKVPTRCFDGTQLPNIDHSDKIVSLARLTANRVMAQINRNEFESRNTEFIGYLIEARYLAQQYQNRKIKESEVERFQTAPQTGPGHA